MASLRKAKKLARQEGRIIIPTYKKRFSKKEGKYIIPTSKKHYTEREILLRSLDIQIKETNKRLKELEQKGFYNSFSSKKLFERLGGKVGALRTKRNKVVKVELRSNMNMTDLNAVARATRSFLQSQTSSVKNIQRVMKNTKNSMYKTLKLKDDNITRQDVENYYEMLSDKDFDYFAEKYHASDVWALITEAVEAKDTQNRFLKRINTLIDVSDQDVREKAIRLFEKYVL